MKKRSNKKLDYCGKHFGLVEHLIGFILGACGGFLVAKILYGILSVGIILAFLFGVISSKAYVDFLIKRRKQQFANQFCDYLDSVGCSLSCGKNAYEAFISANLDMTDLYKPDSPICIESARLSDGLRSGRSIEELLLEMANRSRNENVEIFGDVYSICNMAGGNLKKIINETKESIIEKTGMETEIRTVLAEPKNELTIMSIMPLVITTALKTLGNNYMSQSSYMVNTIALVVFILAFSWGRKIVSIKV